MTYTNAHQRLVAYRKELVKEINQNDGPVLKAIDRKISALADLLPQQKRVVSKRKAIAKREHAIQIASK